MFIEALSDRAFIHVIGQFSISFFSAYLVANKVEIEIILKNDCASCAWASEVGGSFTISKIETC